ncbi:MAG: hypothetical protein ACLP52_08810 [Streptosporangiaceae bacterium]
MIPRRSRPRAGWLAAAIRLAARIAAAALTAAVLAAALPASLVAAAGAGLAWLRGWPPRRLYAAALWCGPMLAVWLAATALQRSSPGWLLRAPYRAWLDMWHLAAAGSWAAAATVIAPAAIPAGLAAGGLAWSYRIRVMTTGAGGSAPDAAAGFDARRWRHQVRTARARIAAPGSVPLTGQGGDLLPGAAIRAVGHPGGPVVRIPYPRMRAHQVVIGTSGSGKTTLLLRLWAGFMATALQRCAAGAGPPPLLVVLDCKGGADARRIAERVRRVLRDAGARSVAIWPDDARLSLWALPPHQLITTLLDLVEHGTGAAAYYADVMEAVVALAVGAPCGPPQDSADFLARLDADWLARAYGDGQHQDELGLLRAAARHLGDVSLRYRTVLGRLGAALDGAAAFADADAWYCILEGTAEVSVAEGQARALVDLLASAAASAPGQRDILLAVDEFSAVSRRLPIWQLYERARSLGLAVQVSAQSWPGLAGSEDERYRIAAAADGGIWLLRTPYPEPVTALAGQRPVTETTRGLRRVPLWRHEGSSRLRAAAVVDPELIRHLDVGQVAYIYRGGVSYIQVKRLVAVPAGIGPAVPAGPGGPAGRGQVAGSARAGRTGQDGPAAAVVPPPRAPGGGEMASPGPGGRPPGRGTSQRPAGPPLPDASPVLDEAFGPEPPGAGR